MRTRLVIASVTAASCLLAACGGDDDVDSAAATTQGQVSSTGSTGTATQTGVDPRGDCVAKADAYLTDWETLPTELPADYTPLSKAPSPGKIIKLFIGPVPSEALSADAVTAAAQAAGWEAKGIAVDGTVEDVNAKFQQAIAEKPTVITLAGWPVAALQQSLAAAEEAGITVVLSSVLDTPTGTGTAGFAAVTNGGQTASRIGELNAYKLMADSGCKADVAVATLPFPILDQAVESFTSTLADNCPECRVTRIDIQTADLGTPTATGAIVSALQANSDITYLYAIIGSLAAGLGPAQAQAGIDDVRIFGAVPDDAAIKALQDGTNAWWVGQESNIDGWTAVDAAVRVFDAGDRVPELLLPLSLLTPENIPSNLTTVPTYPAAYQDLFAALWKA